MVVLLAPRPTGSGSPCASQVHFGHCNRRTPQGWTPRGRHQLCSRGAPSPTTTRLMLYMVGAAAASRPRLPPLLAPLDAATWCPAHHGGAGAAAAAWFRVPEPTPASYFPFPLYLPLLQDPSETCSGAGNSTGDDSPQEQCPITQFSPHSPADLNKGSADFLPARLRNCFS